MSQEEPLPEAADEDDPDARVAELGSIAEGHVARPEAIRRLRALSADPEPGVRAHAARASADYLDDEELAGRVLALAGPDEPPLVRAAALEALGAVLRAGDLAGAWAPGYAPEPQAGEPAAELVQRALEAVRAAFAGDEPQARLGALPGLAACRGHEPAVEAAIEAAWAAPDLTERALAVRCMGRTGAAARWGAQVRRALDAREPEVRLAAVEAAGAAELREALPRLLELLQAEREPEPLRVAAAGALAAFGAAGAAALLARAEEDPLEEVRDAARAALAELTG